MLLQPLLLIPLFKHFRFGLKNTLHGVKPVFSIAYENQFYYFIIVYTTVICVLIV